MDLTVHIGRSAYSNGTEITDWVIDSWFAEICKDEIAWCQEHYPDTTYTRTTEIRLDQAGYLINWYANFTSLLAKVHYIMANCTHDAEGPHDIR